jgi:hypothetical protein
MTTKRQIRAAVLDVHNRTGVDTQLTDAECARLRNATRDTITAALGAKS